MGVDVLLQAERVTERLGATVALPLPLTHVRAHTLDVACEVENGCEHVIAFPTCETP